MFITRRMLKKLIFENVLQENTNVDKFAGELKVYDYDKDRNANPSEDEIVLKIKTDSQEKARGYAALFANKQYQVLSGNGVTLFEPDPISPEFIYLKLKKK
jgi:flavodoxin